MLFADRIGTRLALGWTMGTLVSALGVYFSVLLDTPTGATIVCRFGGVLILMFFVYLLLVRKKQSTTLGKAPVVDEAKDRVFQKHP